LETAGITGKNFFFKAAGGVLAGSSDNIKDTPFSFDASANFRLLPNFYTGAGAGIDFLEESYMQVFLNMGFHFRELQFTPFIGVQGGCMVPLDNELETNELYYPYYGYGYGYGYYSYQTLENKGDILFICDGDAGLKVYDASAPLTAVITVIIMTSTIRALKLNKLLVPTSLFNFADHDGIVLSVFFGTFGTSGIPHVPFFNLKTFCSGKRFKIFAPLSRIFKRSFVDFAEILTAQGDV